MLFGPVTIGVLGPCGKRQPDLDEETRTQLYEKTEGWAAGLVLMLEQARGTSLADVPVTATPQIIFDYLAGEFLDNLDATTRTVLLRTALLPQISAAAAADLSGEADAGKLLNELCKNHYLVSRLPTADEPLYQHHPLLREFLMRRAQEELSTSERKELRTRAAVLLEKQGNVENTAALLIESRDWDGLVRFIREKAETMLAQGRGETLEQWLEELPEERLNGEPWMLYWLGICRLPLSPRESARLCERAFELFKSAAEPDPEGLFQACSGAMDGLLHDLDDLSPLDRWIEEMYALLEEHDGFPSTDIESNCTRVIYISMYVRQNSHPDIETWGERAMLASRTEQDPNRRMEIHQVVALSLMYTGRFGQALEYIDYMRKVAEAPDVTPLALTTLRYIESTYYGLSAAHKPCLQAMEDGLEIAKSSGVHIWDIGMLVNGFVGAVAGNQMDRAREIMGILESTSAKIPTFDMMRFRLLAAVYYRERGDVMRAYQELKIALRLATELGSIFFEAITRLILTEILFECGDTRKARAQFRPIKKLARSIKNRLLEFVCLVNYAQLAWEQGRRQSALRALKYALALGREKNFRSLPWKRRQDTARLCVLALEHGIETEYVRAIIQRQRLIPDTPPLNVPGWPWAYRVYTLGQFSLLKDDVPHATTGKGAGRPVELLKVLIAMGGRDVHIDKVTDALWPRIDADYAHKSFNTTLHRLRKLLGDDRAVTLANKQLNLDARFFWLDTWALEQTFENISALGRKDREEIKESRVKRLADALLDLYQGPFLISDAEHTWVIAAQERLRERFLRAIGELGRYFEDRDKTDRAADLYQRGLEAAPLAEGLYRQLMLCYRKARRIAEAAEAYNRCAKVLKADLGVEPSRETRKIYESLSRYESLSTLKVVGGDRRRTDSIVDARYKIEEEIGAGSTGTVYKAWDSMLEAWVAIKLLKPEYTADPDALERVRKEIILSRDIGHPNILRIYHMGAFDRGTYLTMQWIDGKTLGDAIASNGALPLDKVLSITGKLVSALAAAHERHILHRDIKPGNILLGDGDEPYLADFGLARLIGQAGITRQNVYLGTPQYSSPEQANLKPLDERSDLYALGLVIYEMTTGRRPFEADDIQDLLEMQRSMPAPDPRDAVPTLPDSMSRLILRCLEKKPSKRYSNTRALESALQDVARDLA